MCLVTGCLSVNQPMRNFVAHTVVMSRIAVVLLVIFEGPLLPSDRSDNVIAGIFLSPLSFPIKFLL